MGVGSKTKRGMAAKNNNRPPKNKKEHATETP
jgi:hypothetical protein